MVRIVIVGAAGRMGRLLVAHVLQTPDFQLAGAIECPAHSALGTDAGTLAGVGHAGIEVTADLQAAVSTADAVVSFAGAECTVEHARTAVRAGCSAVIGTTGLSSEAREALVELGADGGRIVLAPNMSVGINLLFHLCRRVVPVLGPDYDIEVVEMHHNQKKDAPSGTAVRLGEILAEAAGLDYGGDACHGRCGNVGARPARQIGMHAIRGGDVVGDHTVVFAGPGERIELTHRASSRETFVKGAMRAVRFLLDAPPGLYDMQDVLGLA